MLDMHVSAIYALPGGVALSAFTAFCRCVTAAVGILRFKVASQGAIAGEHRDGCYCGRPAELIAYCDAVCPCVWMMVCAPLVSFGALMFRKLWTSRLVLKKRWPDINANRQE
jgi:hypothetical protein